MSVWLYKPKVELKVDGKPCGLIDASISGSRYQRAAGGSITLPDDLARKIEPFTPVELTMWYAHGGPESSYKFYVTDEAIYGDRIGIKDKYFELGGKHHELVDSFQNVTFDDFIGQLLILDVPELYIRQFETVKAVYHVLRASKRQVIEQACRDWRITPLIYFGPTEEMYVGEDRQPSETVTTLEYGKTLLDRIDMRERRITLDYHDEAPEVKTTKRGKNAGQVREVYHREDADRQELVLPYLRVNTAWLPWIFNGDHVFLIDKDGTYTDEYVVVTHQHNCGRWESWLELEAAT